MRISQISVRNFGILQEVDFDLPGPDNQLVFVNANNGHGKTTLQGAVRWCLYGEAPKDRNGIVSNLAFENDDEATVTVMITLVEDDGEVFKIRREQRFSINLDQRISSIGQDSAIVSSQNPMTGALTEIPVNADAWLEERFPRRLSKFFLVDGEEMKDFFRTNVRQGIEDAIREIAGVDYFDAVAKRASDLESKARKSAARLNGKDAEKVNSELESERRLESDNRAKIEKAERELEDAETRRDEIVVKLAASEATEADANQIETLDNRARQHEETMASSHQNLVRELIEQGTYFLCGEAFKKFEVAVDEARQNEILPPPFDADRLKRLLADGTCICGCNLRKGNEGFDAVNGLIEKYSTASELGGVLNESWKAVEAFDANRAGRMRLLDTFNKSLVNAKASLKQAVDDQDELNRKLALVDIDAIRVLGEEKQTLEDTIRNRRGIVTQGRRDLQEAATRILKLERELKDSISNSAQSQRLLRTAAVAKAMADAAGKIHQSSIEQVRRELEVAISSRFERVMGTGFHFVVTKDFGVRTTDGRGNPVDLSAGQWLMLAYIFAIAIRDVVHFSVPLIVDTPLGKLDSANTSLVAEFLIDLVTTSSHQFLLLMHDMEYTPLVHDAFHESAKPLDLFLEWAPNFSRRKSVAGRGIAPSWYEKSEETKLSLWPVRAGGLI
jgi:DNA sulfur modification protein DndD